MKSKESGICYTAGVSDCHLLGRLCLEMWKKSKKSTVSPNPNTVPDTSVTCRLDYCNAVYVGLPWKTIQKLQLMQNAAACPLASAS